MRGCTADVRSRPIADIRTARQDRRVTAPLLRHEEALLLSEVDDDSYGLWEIIGMSGAETTGELKQEELIELVLGAIENGNIEVFAGPFGGNEEALSRDAALETVRDWNNWRHREPPEPVFRIMTTKQGDEAFRRWVDQYGLPHRS